MQKFVRQHCACAMCAYGLLYCIILRSNVIPCTITTYDLTTMRASAKCEPFPSWFSKGKKSLHRGSGARLLGWRFFHYCVDNRAPTQPSSPSSFSSTALYADGTNGSADRSCARPYNSQPWFAVSRSEYVEIGAAPRVLTGMVTEFVSYGFHIFKASQPTFAFYKALAPSEPNVFARITIRALVPETY